MPKVWNKHHKNAPPEAVYIGRPSPYGNPYEIGRDGTRAEVIEKFRQDMETLKANAPRVFEHMCAQLRGKDLVCWCAPAACHGDILLEYANA